MAFGIWIAFQNPYVSPTPQNEPTWLATLSSSNDPIWDGPDDFSGKFHAGKLKLISGVAELEFRNSAQFIIEGPCALEIIDGNKIELEHGKIWGHCPPSAHGFEVLAPGGNHIVDLGTEFGVGVAPGGEIEVHVFDGEVEVFSNDHEKLALDAGSALKISPGKKPLGLNANFGSFTNTRKLQSDRYHRHRSALLKRDDLLAYYDFSSLSEKPSTLADSGPSQISGKVIDALPVKGRIADKAALLFEKKGDAVALDLADLPLGNEFTLAMWIKPTDFARSHMAIFNSNGFAPGKFHFQVHDDGRLVTAISGVSRYSAPRHTIKTNAWQFVAVSWNLQKETAQLFLNGQLLQSSKSSFRKKTSIKKVNFGKCQIGAWAKPSYGHNRSFEGRIDEVMIFSSELGTNEMSRLYEASRP